MSIFFQPLFEPTPLSATTTMLFTASANTRIDALTCSNSMNSLAALTIFLVPQGQVPHQGNQVVNAYPVSPLRTFAVDDLVGHVLVAGDSLWALASAVDQLVLFGSGTVSTD